MAFLAFDNVIWAVDICAPIVHWCGISLGFFVKNIHFFKKSPVRLIFLFNHGIISVHILRIVDLPRI